MSETTQPRLARTVVMLEIPEDRSERHRLFKAIEAEATGRSDAATLLWDFMARRRARD